jgi:CRP-like cAMP-binding protein
MVGGATMVATAIAIDDCELAAASADELRRLCETDLEFGYYFMRQLAKALARRLLAARLQLLDLFRQETLASTSPEASL